jgi:hypothetical protein
MESHKEAVLDEIEPMPHITYASQPNDNEVLRTAPLRRSKFEMNNTACPDTTRVTVRQSQAAPGAYAVQMLRTTPPHFAQSSATARSSSAVPSITPSSLDVGTADEEINAVRAMDEEVGRNLLVAGPGTRSSTGTDIISNLGVMDGFEFSTFSEPCLAEATPVEDPVGGTLMHANAVDLNKVQKMQRHRGKQEKLFGLAFLLLIFAGAIIVGSVVLTHPTHSREKVATPVPIC